jgi:hypothetical protein
MTLPEIMTDGVSSKPSKVKNRFAASNIPRDDRDMIIISQDQSAGDMR